MNKIYSSIQKVFNKNLYDKKVFLMPSYSTGNQLLNSTADEGINLLNYRIETIRGLVEKECHDYLYQNNLEIIDNNITKIFLYNILLELFDNNKLQYFKHLELTKGVINAFNNTIYELRMANLMSDELSLSSFINNKKGNDIKLILKKYENYLKRNNYIDEAELLKIYLHNIKSKDELYIIPENMKLKKLEEDIINRIPKSQKYILKFKNEEFFSVSNNNSKLKREKDGFESQQLKFNMPIDKISIKKANGESNEISGIVREIKDSNIPFGKINIFYTIQEPYSQFLYHFTQNSDLPVTFSEGISINNSNPAKLLFSILQFINNDYSFSYFKSILNNKIIKIDYDSISSNRIIKLLSNLKIGWGKDRYISIIERKIKRLDEYEETKYNKQQKEDLENIKNILEKLFSYLPNTEDEMVNPTEASEGLINLIKEFGYIKSEMDGEAHKKIIEVLKHLGKFHNSEIDVDDYITYLKDIIGSMRIGYSNPKPGHLHFCSYKNGLWNKREFNYFVGLDETKFPGQVMEDPILLDEERKKLGNIDLKQKTIKENKSMMFDLINFIEGYITFYYSAYDTLDYREILSSNILLKIYRIMNHNEDLSYKDFTENIINIDTFIPKSFNKTLNQSEYWMYLDKYKNIDKKEELFKNMFKELFAGKQALDNKKDGFNLYNGNINIDSSAIDPRENGRIISATELESIAKCPYKYFLDYVLRIKIPEEAHYDPENWLDPLERGSLLHKIFERFYKEINFNLKQIDYDKAKKFLLKIVQEEINKKHEEIPPPNQLVFNREASEIKSSAEVFLINEINNSDNFVPKYFEYSFGYDYKKDSYPAAKIKLPSGEEIKLRGKIDRIDQTDDNNFNIIDYKTGSTYAYSNSDYFKEGSQLQHAIYALAFEDISDEPVSVNQSIYYFPTLKGEGQKIIREPEGIYKREEVKEIIDGLLDIISDGNFVMCKWDYNNKDCDYCDYNTICDREFKDKINEIIDDEDIQELEIVRRIKAYE